MTGSVVRTPHSSDAERAVLGAILLENALLPRIAAVLTEAEFFSDQHRRIYKSMAALSGRGIAIDPVTVKEALQASGDLEVAGGPAYIASLLDAVPHAAHSEHYARIVKEKSGDRAAAESAQALIAAVFARNGAGLGEAREAIIAAAAACRRSIDSLLHESSSAPAPLHAFDVAAQLTRGGWEPVPVLDDFLWARTFTYLSGSSGSFKTWIMLTWAVALATSRPFIRQSVHGEHRVLFVECESSIQILQRLPRVCTAYGVELDDVLKRVHFFVPRRRPLRLEDSTDATHLLRIAEEHDASWVFIDSLRRVTSLDENRAEDMARLADTAFLPLREADHGVLLLEHPAPSDGVGQVSDCRTW